MTRNLLAVLGVGSAAAACGGGGTVEPPPPPPVTEPVGQVVDLGPGERILMSGSDLDGFTLVTGGGTFDVIIESAARTPGSHDLRIELTPVSGGAAAAPPVGARAPGDQQLAGPAPPAIELPNQRELMLRQRSFELESKLRANVRNELRRKGAVPVRRPPILAESVTRDVGDTITLRIGVGVGLVADCDSDETVDAVVARVGDGITILEDVRVAGRLPPTNLTQIETQLDEVVYPLITGYFGEPADIDRNGTILALITPEVNQLSEDDGSIVTGFFFSGDLANRSTCSASNQAELFYLIAPDPSGEYGPDISVEYASRLIRTTIPHELVHLLNTEQRVIIGDGNFGDREHAWLDEGMAHLGEEISGLKAAGLPLRAEHTLADLAGDELLLPIFNEFQLLNLSRFGKFLAGGCNPSSPHGPGAVLALGDADGKDPGGLPSLAFRGFGWGFVRWLGDHFGPEGDGLLEGAREEDLFRLLSSGGPSHLSGVANVENAVAQMAGPRLSWPQLVDLYLTSVLREWRGPPDSGMERWLSWDLGAVYGSLNESNLGDSCPYSRAYPLAPTFVSVSGSGRSNVDFRVNAATGRYIQLFTAGAEMVVIRVLGENGTARPSGAEAQVSVVRSP